MKILYVHGFGSSYDPEHEKIQYLKTLGTVIGVDVDYCDGFTSVFERVLDAVLTEKVDLIVGTSMGGYMAAHVGAEAGIPFVAMNPAIKPNISLQRWVGAFVDYNGHEHYLSESVCETYPDIVQKGNGLVLLDSGDEVIPAYPTQHLLENVFDVRMFSGGNHRFAHLETALPIIKKFFEVSENTYGLE